MDLYALTLFVCLARNFAWFSKGGGGEFVVVFESDRGRANTEPRLEASPKQQQTMQQQDALN